MALPLNHPLSDVFMTTVVADVATGRSGFVRAPVRGKVVRIGTLLGAAATTADATITTSIAATAITGGAFVITQSGSAAGDEDYASTDGTGNSTISALNFVNEGDLIKWAVTGSGGGGGTLQCYVNIVRT
jgi:hypothetical protein